MAADPDLVTLTLTGNKIVEEASRRFMRCAEWEANCRQNFLSDYKFAHGDSDNGFQWPNRIRQNRDIDARPCLTMNIVRQHNLQIVNEAKQNKSSVVFKPTGGAATKDAADLYNAMFRRVEYISNAQAAYETACEYQVAGGWGWIRLVTEYEDNKTFNQDLRIKRVWDPLSIYCDMDAQEKNKSDSRYAFAFDLVPDEQLEEAYPGMKELMTLAPLGGATTDDSWNIKDHTRICEYFRKVPRKDRLLSFVNPNDGRRVQLAKSKMPKEVYQQVLELPLTKYRDLVEWDVEWYLIVGQQIVDRAIWPGKYIPLVMVLGEETIIEGMLDRKGHTRAMKDAQRMYNYNCSSQVEFGALQSKTPWIVAVKAIEEYESMWNSANTTNHAVLPFNHVGDDGVTAIPPPIRQEPPTASPAYESGMETAFNQMMMTSGQWQNQMGMGGNERTGEAISRRQEQGYTAVFHFQNNYGESLKFIGRQYLDLVPKLYDTPRLLKLQMDNGEDFDLQIDPTAKQALQQTLDKDQQITSRVLNPALGEYDVQADVGPAYGTRREETVRAMTLLLTQNPALTSIIGDLLLSAMDFKEAGEAAQRLKRMVPGQALGKGPTEAEQQMQQQIQALNEALSKALQELGQKKIKLAGKDELRDIEVYEAETKRFEAMMKHSIEQGELKALFGQLTHDMMATQLNHIQAMNEGQSSEA